MSRVTVNVNGLSLVHEDSGGVSTATLPDVCFTPPTGAPAPYPNVAWSRDLAAGSSLVRADGGHRIAVAGSAFARSTGGEPGSSGGVTSGVSGGEATFLTHSFDVTVEGRGACRLTDKMLHNHGNTIDCAGVVQATVAESRGDTRELLDRPSSPRKKKRPTRAPSSKVVLGVDTNRNTLITSYACGTRKRYFVGRYLIAFPAPPAPSAPYAYTILKDPAEGSSNGHADNPGLTPTEVGTLQGGGMSVVAIWEVTKYRAIEAGTPEAQYALGVADATVARQQIAWCGNTVKPIYFTVDFDVNASKWHAPVMSWLPEKGKMHCPHIVALHEKTGTSAYTGDLILHYFRGIGSVLPQSRIGVYGTYYTLKKLFDAPKMIQYGWQQTFGRKSAKRNGKIEPRAQLHQYNISSSIQTPGGYPLWGVQGAGALDFDLALTDDFGQW
jgi:hypothetical protein